jgi:hypothetical protein
MSNNPPFLARSQTENCKNAHLNFTMPVCPYVKTPAQLNGFA